MEIKFSNPKFHHLTSYRRYRLRNRAAFHGDDDREQLGRWYRNMKDQMDQVSFCGSEPIKLIRWLDHFVAQCDADLVPEVAAVRLSPHFLDQPARDEFTQGRAGRSQNPLAPSEGFQTWPGAVNHLVSLYIDDYVLAEAGRRLSNIAQEPTETVRAYYARLSSANRDIPDTYEPAELISIFIEGLKDTLRPKAQVERPRFDSNRRGLRFMVQKLTKIEEVWRTS